MSQDSPPQPFQTQSHSCNFEGTLPSEKNIFRLEITMDQPLDLEYCERIKELSCKDLDELGRETSERVLLDELVQIR